MATKVTRVVHYINHFFAGVGGEEKASHPLEVRKGAVGPGQGLKSHLGGRGEIVATIVCGDNYFSENLQQVKQRIVEEVKKQSADLLIAGPAFNAGRYGFGCAEACQAVASALDIPCVMAMYPENPGVAIYQQYKSWKTLCIPTADSAAGMSEALPKLASFGLRMASGEKVGPAAAEGYILRGIRELVQAQKTGVERAIDMLTARLADQPFQTEVPIRPFDQVEPAAPIKNMKEATLVIVSTAGVTRPGNPDKFLHHGNIQWRKYSIEGLSRMEPKTWEVTHGGYNNAFVNANPNLGVPLDVLREMEDAGVFRSLVNQFYNVPGTGVLVNEAKRMGAEIARDIKSTGADGIVLVST